MMNKEQLLLAAQRTIENRRQKALDKCEQNLRQLRSHDDWNSCEHSLKSAQVKVALHNDAAAKETVKKFSDMQTKLLEKYGFAENDLVPDYFCKKCNDSGFVNGNKCSCLQTEIRNLLTKDNNVTNKSFTFENSKETNKHNVAVYKKATEVCLGEKFKNMLLTGGTGSGKTYLLTACANLCTTLGKSVMFTTAYSLGALLLEIHLSDLATKQNILDSLTDVDVLAIDDLGTENVYRDVTAEYLFSVVNERISRGKQTFFSTNLSIADIRERYDERIFSRLVDQNITFVAKLEGNDKRLAK